MFASRQAVDMPVILRQADSHNVHLGTYYVEGVENAFYPRDMHFSSALTNQRCLAIFIIAKAPEGWLDEVNDKEHVIC